MTRDELQNTSKEQDNQPQTAQKEDPAATPAVPRYSPPSPKPPAPRPPFGMSGMPIAGNIKVIKTPVFPAKDDSKS